jgi:type VI secretion system protein ImpI
MALHLKIENMQTLPDGGPVSMTLTGKRGIDIGRDSHLDWTLPDPTRYISGKHAEIRYQDGGYWLHDVSRNGTLLNGSDHRMQAPHRLRTGDRFTIGHYIIAVALDADPGEAVSQALVPSPARAYENLWTADYEAAPPIERAQLRAPRERPAPVNPDFLDWAADVPPPGRPATAMPPDDMSWALGPKSKQAAPPPPPPEMPAPRRPLWTAEPNLWAAEHIESESARDQSARPMTDLNTSPARVPAGPRTDRPDAFLRRLAEAAGIPEDILVQKDPGELADEIGALVRVMVANVMQLLNARRQAKLMARSSNLTVIVESENNPLKFSPTVEEALRNMLGSQTQSYLDARRAIEQGFDDLKRHQIKTYAAMQHAFTALIGSLDPEAIERETEADRGIGALVASRKAKCWDAYVARWQAEMDREGRGPVDAFLLLFAEYYNRADR